jgi:hypothetical protein
MVPLQTPPLSTIGKGFNECIFQLVVLRLDYHNVPISNNHHRPIVNLELARASIEPATCLPGLPLRIHSGYARSLTLVGMSITRFIIALDFSATDRGYVSDANTSLQCQSQLLAHYKSWRCRVTERAFCKCKQ